MSKTEHRLLGWYFSWPWECTTFVRWLLHMWRNRCRWEGPYVLVYEYGVRFLGIEYIIERREEGDRVQRMGGRRLTIQDMLVPFGITAFPSMGQVDVSWVCKLPGGSVVEVSGWDMGRLAMALADKLLEWESDSDEAKNRSLQERGAILRQVFPTL